MILVDYQNYKGGINNLQCAGFYKNGQFLCYFTSTTGKAKARAERWLAKNPQRLPA